MKKTFLLVIVCLLCYGNVFSQKSAVHISVFPPLSTNGKEAKTYTNGFSFNLLAGESFNEQAFTLGGLANIIYNDANGLQVAGIFNYVGNEGKGLQIGGLANVTKNSHKGAQIAGLANISADLNGLQVGGLANIAANMRGIQIGGLANISADAWGMQVGGLANVAANMKGIQIGGLANVTANVWGLQTGGLVNIAANMQGVQVGGLANITANMWGVQVGGIANIAANMEGIQVGGVANVAANTWGIQIGGIANIAANVQGIQLAGVVNKAENVHGIQLGLVNIAYHNDCPIGLINLIKDGEMSLGVTYNGIGSTTLALRSGGRITYGILGLGYNHNASGGSFVTELGIGAHINCTSWLRINNEIKQENIGGFAKNSTDRIGYSLLPAFKIIPCMEIFGGPTISYMKAKNTKNTDLFPSNSLWKKHNDSKLEQVFIGYEVGLQFIL